MADNLCLIFLLLYLFNFLYRHTAIGFELCIIRWNNICFKYLQFIFKKSKIISWIIQCVGWSECLLLFQLVPLFFPFCWKCLPFCTYYRPLKWFYIFILPIYFYIWVFLLDSYLFLIFIVFCCTFLNYLLRIWVFLIWIRAL